MHAYGLKYGHFRLPKAETLLNRQVLISELGKINLPNIKILLTGTGRVGNGAREMLDAMNLKEVRVSDYLAKTFSSPVYC